MKHYKWTVWRWSESGCCWLPRTHAATPEAAVRRLFDAGVLGKMGVYLVLPASCVPPDNGNKDPASLGSAKSPPVGGPPREPRRVKVSQINS
jgi:hypothetical protein